MAMRASTLIGLVMAWGLTACAVGPDYQAPAEKPVERWHAQSLTGNQLKPAADAALQNWWTGFNDPCLNQLMARARQNSPDLKIAYARIEQARAERRASRAELFPTIGGNTGAARFGNPAPGLIRDVSFNFFQMGFDALWEIDVFGRLRRKLEASTADSEAAAEDYRQAWVSLSAELARNYTEYRSLQNQLRITQANLSSQQNTLALTEHLFSEGVGTRYDVVRARALTESTAAGIPQLESLLTANQHQLEVLVGARAGALAAALSAARPVPVAASYHLLMSPAETLRRRPDIRAAERTLAAATALQGAAVAELFPKISVAAFLGVRNTDLENLFKSSAFSWSSGAGMLQPVFNFGRIRAGIDLADARQQEAYYRYEKAVLEALRETETSMTGYIKEDQRRQQLDRSLRDLREAARLATLRYQEGIASFLDVLDAERIQYLEELELARTEAQTSINLIALYKAMGGSGAIDVAKSDKNESLLSWP
jgi:NodT family efflux transporter outer membrane factor (OMF) lipoprotein